LFFGRDREANNLLSLIIAHPVVLLYAQSGAGKTSLLNARVAPLLEEQNSEVFGPTRVGGHLPENINPEDVKNIYIFNALLGLLNDSSDPSTLVQMTFEQFLKTRPRAQQVEGLSSRRIIIFDQFEEIFTSSPERWNDRKGFFDGVGAALENDRSLRVVFAMREEYLASMEPYADMLPEKFRTRLRLQRLRKDAALEAVKKPLKTTDRSFEPGAAEKLVESLLKVPIKSVTGVITDVSEEFIEPVQLQVVCQNLWQKLPEEVKTIGEKYIEDFGDVDQALSTYYDTCIEKVMKEFGISEGQLRRWFGRQLITPDGTRGTVYSDNRNAGGLSLEVVKRFEDLRLVRPEFRGGVPWYELTHDRFIAPIRQSNQNWITERDKGNITSQFLERNADAWLAKGRRNKGLLWGFELNETREWMRSTQQEEIGVSDLVKEFYRASEDAAKRRRLAQMLGVGAMLLIIAIAITFYAYRAQKQAEDAKLIERGRVASTFIKQKKPFDALVWGIKAVEPNVNKRTEPPLEAVNGLSDAVAAFSNTQWLRGLTTPIEHTDISPDGTLALAWNKYEAAVWNVKTGRHLYTLKSSDQKIIPKAVSNKNGNEDKELLWNTVKFTPDGKLIIAIYYQPSPDPKRGDDSSYIFFWDASTGKSLTKLQDKLKNIYPFVRFSNDGSHFLITDESKKMRVVESSWNVHIMNSETGEQIVMLQYPVVGLSGMDFSPLGSHIITTNGSGEAQIWNARTGKQIVKIAVGGKEFKEGISRVLYNFSHDDSLIVLMSGSYAIFDLSGILSVWDTRSGKKVNDIKASLAHIQNLVFSPDDSNIITLEKILEGGFEGGFITRVYDKSTGRLLASHGIPKGTVRESPMGIRVITIEDENRKSTINVWDASSGGILAQLKDIPDKFTDADVSSDLSHIVAYNKDDKDNIVFLWKLGAAEDTTGKSSAPDLLHRACNLLRYQDEYSQVKAECDLQLDKE
jgi:WD40 repeat protein